MLETFGVVVALVASLAPWRLTPDVSKILAPTFRPAERAVDNWRRESAFGLDISTEQAVALALGRDIRGVSRCVRLNNYWCIKKAGWTGEIASDAEGHVAFASASDGAETAAVLLRRYYVDFKLRSARAIVQRWAPAQCGPILVAGAPRAAYSSAARPMSGRTLLGPEPRGLTTRGIGSTLRAKWLASHGRGGGGRKVARAAPRRSIVGDRAAPMLKTPTIAAGIGEMETAGPPVRLAMLPFPGTALGPNPRAGIGPAAGLPAALPPISTMSCGSETARIANYAARIAAGVAAGPDADLALFDSDGKPTPNFSRALFNMAAVEIGPLKARQDLVDAAIARLAARR
jgi:hypothetical protein